MDGCLIIIHYYFFWEYVNINNIDIFTVKRGEIHDFNVNTVIDLLLTVSFCLSIHLLLCLYSSLSISLSVFFYISIHFFLSLPYLLYICLYSDIYLQLSISFFDVWRD